MRRPATIAATAALAATGLATGALVSSGSAQSTGRVITVKLTKERGGFHDAAPRTNRRGLGSIGDIATFSYIATIDGKVDGTEDLTLAITSRKPTPFSRINAVGTLVYHLKEGTIFASGYAGGGKGDFGIVTGGTGAYLGAHGSIASFEGRDVITLAG